MAVASKLGFEYIHQPMLHAGHAEHAKALERWFNLGSLFRQKTKSMIIKKRAETVKTHVGQCRHGQWLRYVETGKEKCKHDGTTVYSGDNCWDRFYCHKMMESGYPYKLVPMWQKAYFSAPKPDPRWLDGAPNTTWGKKVAVHIRMTDGAQIDPNFFVHKIDILRKELTQNGQAPPLFRVQTDGDIPFLTKRAPRLRARDIIFDVKESTTFELAFHRMVVADAFVMARSALSMSAALIGNQSIVMIPYACWDRTTLPHWRKFHC